MSMKLNPYTGKYEHFSFNGVSTESGDYCSKYDQRRSEVGSSPGGGSGGGGGGAIILFLAALTAAFFGIGYLSVGDIKNGTALQGWEPRVLVPAFPVVMVTWITTKAALRSCFGSYAVAWYMALMTSMSLIAGPEGACFLAFLLFFPLASLRPTNDEKGMILFILVGCWVAFAVGGIVSFFSESPTFSNSDALLAVVRTFGHPSEPSRFLLDVDTKNPQLTYHFGIEVMVCMCCWLASCVFIMCRGVILLPERPTLTYMFCGPFLLILSLVLTGQGLLENGLGLVGLMRVSTLAFSVMVVLNKLTGQQEVALSSYLQGFFSDNKSVVFGLILMSCVEIANCFGLLSLL